MAEMGLMGFLLYHLPVLWWLRLSAKAWRHLPKNGFQGRSWLVTLWLAMLSQFFISNFNDILTNYYFVTVLWWMYLGLIANLVWPHVARTKGASLLVRPQNN